MDARLLLDVAGLAVSLIMAVAVVLSSRRPGGQRPFLSLLFLESLLFFLGDLLNSRGLRPGLAFALSLGSNFYGLPSLYFFAQESLGGRPRRVLPHYLPALVAIPLGTGLALATAARGFHGGPALAAYMVALPAGQTAQLIAYGRAGLRLAAPSGRGRAAWPRRIILAALVGYGCFVAISWLSIGNLMLGELLGRPPVPLPGIDFSSSLVAVFLTWTLGLGAVWGADAAAAAAATAALAAPKYGGTVLPSGDAALVLGRLHALLSSEEDLASPEVAPRRLAARINEPYYLVSRAVNEVEGMSMADLVNRYRVDRAKELLVKDSSATILDIALASGFQSKSTFNEVFRRSTGTTPGDYRRRGGGAAKNPTGA
jgi:AraC-like DNA-binding protein